MSEFLMGGTFRRMVAAIVGVGCIALNNKLGLGISEAGQAEITGLIVAFVGQSALKEVAMHKATVAAEGVKTADDALRVLTGNDKPEVKP